MRSLLALALTAAVPLSAAHAAEPLTLQPSGPWVADFADESCALRRNFGTGDTLTHLELRQYQPNGPMEVTVAAPLKPGVSDFRYAFQPDASLRKMGAPERGKAADGGSVVRFKTASLRTVAQTEAFYAARTEGGKVAEHQPTWDPAERDPRLAEITGLALDSAFADDIVLQTGPMTKPMAVMGPCFDQLLTQWGLDPKVQNTLSRRVTLDLPGNDQTQWKALQALMVKAKSADTRIRLMIDSAGKISSCQLLGPAKETPEAAALCQAIGQSAQFEPALDSAGKPVPSYFVEEISVRTAAVSKPLR